MKHDDEGRQFVALHDVRSAIVTASATLSNGTAATFLTGDADYFLDLVEVQFSSGSTLTLGGATAGVDLINDGTTVRHIDLPEAGTVQLRFDVPLKQITKNTPWILDLDDVTGTTVKVDGTFIKKNK